MPTPPRPLSVGNKASPAMVELTAARSWLLLKAAIEDKNHQELVELLEAGADANARRPSPAGRQTATLLHWACERGSALAVETLLAHGALPKAVMRSTVGEKARVSVAHSVLEGVYRSGRSPEATAEALKKMSALIEAGLRPEARVEKEKTLWGELANSQAARTDLLIPWISAGADPDELLDNGTTLLLNEVAAQNLDFVRELLQVGARPDKKCRLTPPLSPLEASLRYGGAGASPIAQLLLAESERRQLNQSAGPGAPGEKPRL